MIARHSCLTTDHAGSEWSRPWFPSSRTRRSSHTLLRPGGVTLEEIEEVTGPIEVHENQPSRPTSPGQLSSHYAPATPLVLSAEQLPIDNAMQVGLLTLQRPECQAGFAAIEVLSEQGCLREAAVHLFAAIRRLDALELDYIVARPVPEVALGRAIMDRLRRAASR